MPFGVDGFNPNFEDLLSDDEVVNETGVLDMNWKFDGKNIALYAIKGRRSQMEDRYVIKTNIMDTGVSLFGIFDGHAGNVSN